MEVIKAHVLAYVDAPHAVLTEHKAVGTLADEAAVRVDARSSLADPTTVLALVHICQHACVYIADIYNNTTSSVTGLQDLQRSSLVKQV